MAAHPMRDGAERYYVENRSGDYYAGPGQWVRDPGLARSWPDEGPAIDVRDTFTPLMVRVIRM